MNEVYLQMLTRCGAKGIGGRGQSNEHRMRRAPSDYAFRRCRYEISLTQLPQLRELNWSSSFDMSSPESRALSS